ncbi:type II secretion system secretin GspD [Kordiimonas laminariae]|uniref:type II secretion system secretin GspD n=1 Tax=Kordiimonas laminariae TaxID=2917717 RepID=UPI001FF68930|nr:type II secretion system secretin GspD [Kordiimonas laminariae]MCK0068971.1 type II secretion system secretin GspD [Kordiimonas laminariae]
MGKNAKIMLQGTLKKLALATLLGASALTLPLFAQDQVLNYRDADIREFINDIAGITGHTFIVDPRVNGRVNVVSSKPVSEEGAFQTFLSALRVNGFTIVPTASGAYKIVPDEVAVQDSVPVSGDLAGDQLVTRVYTLSYVDSLSVQAAAKPFIHKNGRAFARRGSPYVIVTDYAENLKRITQLVESMDVDTSVIKTIALQNTSAFEMADVALRLASRQAGDESNSTISVIPLESSNTLILKGPEKVVSTFEPVLLELDKNNASRGDLLVVNLKHANAEAMLPMLESVVKSVTQKDSSGKVVNPDSNVALSVYAGANALVINATPEMQQRIVSLVRSLDVPRPQVLVEAIVVEVSEGAAKELGLQYILSGSEGSGIPFTMTNYAQTAPNVLAATGALLLDNDDLSEDVSNTLQETAVNSLVGLNGFSVGAAGRTSGGTVFGVILNALAQDTGSNILSTPSIVTLDNEPAKFQSGQEIPITTGEALGSANVNPFRTVERKNVGIILEVTPQINEGEDIRLAIRQEISSVAGPIATGSTELITNLREITTTVRVSDGEIVVLGGLIQQNETTRVDKVPLLGDIPLLGRAFRSDSKSVQKTNLMIFLRPTIMRSAEDARAVTDQKFNYIKGKQAAIESQTPLDQLVKEVLGTSPSGASDTSGQE